MKNILLIEPNTVLVQLYNRILTEKGFHVVSVTSAQAAIDAADLCMPDLVILELQLSGHNGVEFLHEFRSYPEWMRIPLIINTVLPPNRLAEVIVPLKRDLGVTAILYKPKASLDDLLRTVQAQKGE